MRTYTHSGCCKRRGPQQGKTENALPRQDFPDAGITGVFEGDDESTTKSTTPAAMFAECIRDHLDDTELAELLTRLQVATT
ncbi:hypothetical protein RSSM_02731 [Rhodopirellula sallentina SM41]|uniref:Uncharacterized protein n=1 Tax=Rhodopirellula sallentina SM41 TaxID=1263870 RepID=M5UII5_9BACT|nr:hypothetical protein RSSM_02731 [Rhodopirellula sallentina SM41]